MKFKITKVANNEDGSTILSTEDMIFKSSGAALSHKGMLISKHYDCKRYFLVELPVGYCNERVFANRKSVCAILSGNLELKVNQEAVARLGAGDVLKLEDTLFDNPSREILVVSSEPVRALIVQLE